MSISDLMEWFSTDPSALLGTALSAIAVYVAVLVATRINGLRTFRKSSAFDFAATVAIGSMMATIAMSKDTSLATGLVGLLAMLIVQRIVSHVRMNDAASDVIDNSPVLLMAGREVIEENLRKTRISHDDIRAQLRLANVLDHSHIHAVVLETTGDISVLHGEPDRELDPGLFDGVEGAERLKCRQC